MVEMCAHRRIVIATTIRFGHRCAGLDLRRGGTFSPQNNLTHLFRVFYELTSIVYIPNVYYYRGYCRTEPGATSRSVKAIYRGYCRTEPGATSRSVKAIFCNSAAATAKEAVTQRGSLRERP